MANDPPTTLRMGFGYHQARASGLRGLRTDRSPNQVNRIIGDRKTERAAIRYIREMVEGDPEWGPFVEHWVREGLGADDISTALYNAQFYAWLRRNGYRNQMARRPPF
jgi:hypothetical protein